MKRLQLRFGTGFRVAISSANAQAAQMSIARGKSEGGPGNRHRGADQWLFVVHGSGLAIVNGNRIKLQPGTLLLIRRGEYHEIKNTGSGILKTLNFYVPRAYMANGAELPAGRS